MPGVELEILRDLLPIRPDDRLLRLRIAQGLLELEPPATAEARRLLQSVAEARSATVRERADAHFLLGRVDVLDGRPEQATPHLEHYYLRRLEHAVCPKSLIACDRDYPLHLLSVGDAGRLEHYLRRRALRAEQLRAEAEKQPRLATRSYYRLSRLGPPQIDDDIELSDHFLEPGCGLPSAVPHLRAQLAERPDDPALARRLAYEQSRPCLVTDGPKPWHDDTSKLAGTWADRQAELLLADEYP